MKKSLTLLLAAVLLLSLAGCGGGNAPSVTPAPEAETAAPTPTDVPAAQEPETPGREGQVIAEIRRESKTLRDEDGTELLSFASALPAVTLPGRKAAEDKINAALKAEYDLYVNGDPGMEGVSGKESYLASAREDLERRRSEGFQDSFMLFSMERDAFVSRADERVISFTYSDYTYTGGVHGYAGLSGVNYDAVTGRELRLSDLADDPDAFLKECADRLRETSRDAEHIGYIDAYYPGYEEALAGLLRDGLWYFTDQGLTVVANPYEIAPYAFGRMEFTLPYEWLRLRMKEEYLPPETEADGELRGEIADEPGECLYTADVDTDGQGACVVFTAEGAVKDLRIVRAVYYEYGGSFGEAGDVLCVSRLEDGDRLCVRTWIPDVMPNLMLKYTDGSGQRREYLISQSGRDGSLVLMDARPWKDLPLEISQALPFTYDVDKDGENETIDLVRQEGEESRWVLTVDGNSVGDVLAMDARLCSLWLADIDSNGIVEIIFSGDMGSDDYVTCAWRGDTLESISFTGENRRGANPWELTKTVDGRAVMSAWQLYIEGWSYQLGTYRAARPYTVSDGVITPASRNGWTYVSNDYYLVVKKNLPVILDSGMQTVLPPGTAILLTGTDGSVARFTGSGDLAGSILLEFVYGDNGGWYINGLSENEYFETLPYAG